MNALYEYGTEHAWLGSFRHVQMREDEYFRMADVDPPQDLDADNEADNMFVDDDSEEERIL